MASPRPLLPPVTSTLRTGAHQLSGSGHLERRNESDQRRHLVRGERRAARFQDLLADALIPGLTALEAAAVREHDVRCDDGTGDRIAPRLNERHAYQRMRVDHGLDLFRVDLEPADIDDAAAAANEIV